MFGEVFKCAAYGDISMQHALNGANFFLHERQPHCSFCDSSLLVSIVLFTVSYRVCLRYINVNFYTLEIFHSNFICFILII